MHHGLVRRGTAVVVGVMSAFAAAVIVAPAASAAVDWFVVTPANGGNDANPCTAVSPCATLAHAVGVSAADDTIHIGPGTFPTNLTVEGANRTFVGAGVHATFLDGGGFSTVLIVAARSTTTISDLTVEHGHGSPSTRNAAGIYNAGGNLVLARVAIVDNLGNGVTTEASLITMTDTTVSGNVVGLHNFDGYTDVSNSTFSNNEFGIKDESWGSHFAQITVTGNSVDGIDTGVSGFPVISASTIANNGRFGIGAGPAYFLNGSGASIDSTILSGNAGGNCSIFLTAGTDSPGLLVDMGYNLEGDPAASCAFTSANHDIVGASPQLGPLHANGGVTKTMVPSWKSPALDVIPSPITLQNRQACPGRDPRGVIRPQRASCDIGAVEILPPTAPAAPTAPTATSLPAAARLNFVPPVNGGAPITAYNARCTSSDGGAIGNAIARARPITVEDLTPGKTYTCTISATNAIGTGPPSVPTGAVVPGAPTVPSAPRAPTATRIAAGTLRVAFTPPADNGSPIMQYSATCSWASGGVPGTATGTGSPIKVSGLTPTKTYLCIVKAKNALGFGPPSPPSAPKAA